MLDFKVILLTFIIAILIIIISLTIISLIILLCKTIYDVFTNRK